jgi:hypothetical protein
LNIFIPGGVEIMTEVIIVSGYAETDRIKETKRLRAGIYVKKLYVMGKIGMAIQEELDRKLDDGIFNSTNSYH